MLDLLKRWTRKFARDEGVAGVVIAMLVMIAAFSALAVFMSKYAGPGPRLAKEQEVKQSSGVLRDAVLAHFLQQAAPAVMPCPDTDQDGDADCTDTTGTALGTLPWLDLGLGRADAIDPYGRYYTYVVVADAEARELCTNVENDYDSSDVEYTGSLLDQTALEVRLGTQIAGEGAYVPFAIISHGRNGLGGLTSSGTTMAAPAVGSNEANNVTAAGPSVVFSGPYDADSATVFDDVVFAPTREKIQQLCEDLSPGGEKNAALTEDFSDTGPGFDSTKFETTGSATVPTQTNGQAQFTATTSYLATADGYELAPTVRPVYVSAYWTPAASPGGFSIATRATTDDLTSGTDTFNGAGLTFRFYSTGTTGANSLTIRDNTTTYATSAATYAFTAGEQYHLEVYDSGSDVWARITQVSNTAITAEVSATSVTIDTGGDQKVVFINGAGTNRLDDVTIGLPMLSLATGGATDGYASTTLTTVNGSTTGSITLEAWIRPTELPTGTNETTIISQWDTAEEDDSSFRLYLLGSALMLDLNDAAGSGDAETFDLRITPTVDEWMHIAVTYDAATKSVRAYKDGALASTTTAALDNAGIASAAHSFAVGADSVNTPPAHFFDGNISDVRVWDDVRTATEVERCFQKRLPSAAPCNTTNLVVNWKLEPTVSQGGMAETDATAVVGTAGILTNAGYRPALSVHFRPISTEFCPDGTVVSPYQCDFRTVAHSTTDDPMDDPLSIPGNLSVMHVKAWGGGGGAYDVGSDESFGGGGGFSSALIETIDGASVAGSQFDVTVGGGGTGSTSQGNGGGGGGASGVMIGSDLGLVAGGGGGASFSDLASINNEAGAGTGSFTINCDGDEDTIDQCGYGGGGGGAGGATTSQANDSTAAKVCGGHGGDNTPTSATPPHANACSLGGVSPSATDGGTGGGTATGGVSAIGDGGAGYTSATRIGAGGGGGGAVGGEAGGYAATDNNGFGGGGGSGSADSSAFNVKGEASGITVTAGAACSGSNVTGTLSSGSNIITNIDAPSAWYVDCAIDSVASGTLINNNATITAIDRTARTVTMSHNATGGGGTATDLFVTGTGAATTSFSNGGVDDDDYAPTYATATNPAPGRGGFAGTPDGQQGAVILKW